MPYLNYSYHADGEAPEVSTGMIFVFGSNLAGRHGAGAALLAHEKFGAVLGRGSGPMGKSYGIPTKDKNLRRLGLAEIKIHAYNFMVYAEAHPKARFFITRVGCGLAGYKNEQIAPLFKFAPINCNFPYEWKQYL